MKKALQIISIAMPFVVFALFFIPALYQVIPAWAIDVVPKGDYSFSIKNFTEVESPYAQACLIIFFIVSIVISCLSIILYKRTPLSVCLNILSLSYFWIISLIWKYQDAEYITLAPHAAFYISLILSAFFLAVFIAYAVKWLKPRLASIPPREHKPTKSERIAELERQVAELTKEKDAE